MTWPLPWTDAIIGALVAVLGAAVLVIDARTHRIPNRLVLAWACGVLVVGVVSAGVRGVWSDLLAAAAVGAGLFVVGYLIAVAAPDAFGFGDVKLLGCVGLAVGHLDPQLVVVWLLGLAVGTLLWLVLARWLDGQYDRRTPLRRRHIAFGPPIVLGLWLTYAAVLLAPAA